MTRSLGKLGLVLVCAVATVSAGLLVQASANTRPTAAVAKIAKKHRASRVRPFKPGARFVCTIVSNEAGGFKKSEYVAGVDTVTCSYKDDDTGQTKPWTFVKARRHANPKRLTLVFIAQDIDGPEAIVPEPEKAAGDDKPAQDAKPVEAVKAAVGAFISSNGSITITVDDDGDPSTTDPGFGFDVEPVDIDPCP